MSSISVVIIAKNEAENIVDCIRCARLVSEDVIVADSGSEDNTPALAVEAGARLLKIAWKGNGASRNTGAEFTKNEWILALDTDERVTPSLAEAIQYRSLDREGWGG
jgi:(heptosyl)LPS beta-1,4-glucosyltransferase